MNAPALALAAFAGLLHAASIAWPWGGEPLWPLQVLSLSVLAGLLLRTPSPWRATWLGAVFALAWLAGSFWWLFISMHRYGGLAAPLAAAAVGALAAFLGLYTAAAAHIAVRWRSGVGAAWPALFAAGWLLAELLRATWFTGFPWGAAGYAHVDGPLAALAPWIGVHGMGAVSAGFAALIAQLAMGAHGTRRASGIALAGLSAFVVAAHLVPPGDTRPLAQPPLSVALLQGNIPQDEKFQRGTGVAVALKWYGQQLREARADLVVAPETALPMLPHQLPDGYLPAILATYADAGRIALVGVPLGSYEEGYTNSVIGLRGGEIAYRYDKHHLVPFGEFIPPLFKWFTRMMNIPLGDFNRGDVGQPSMAWRGERLAPNICYEDLFGEELAARFQRPGDAPTVFVNVSNIAWFGDSVAIDQHLQISRLRALEFRRPMLRATNTGATVIIDREGRVTHSLPRLTRGVLAGTVQGGEGLTPYAWWASRFGLWPLWLLALGTLALAAGASRRRAGAP
ncbi:apolipoprotein N-acyltransferase [Ramlibacter sp.]|uniref:apolipoprotein N-acyltransferase n=1 Tax=Ramlibacter sp. TaxID=1917967 RepID=UPI0035B41627